MRDGKTIAVVVPAYNEERLIAQTLTTMPDFVDRLLVINDASTDRTREVIQELQAADARIELIDHATNTGVGGALVDGYLRAREGGYDAVAVMAGDAQMNPDDLGRVVAPILAGTSDYVKGNRLLREDVIHRMPRHRYIGNSVLTLLTKFATGYWQIIDPQCGYTAISHEALARIPIGQMTRGYGYCADLLNMVNLSNYRACDVEVEPVYGAEQSTIRLHTYIPRVSWLLLRLFVKRLVHKYLVREFHPLIFFYLFSLFNAVCLAIPLTIRLFYKYAQNGFVPSTTLIILTFSSSMALLSLFFGMWLDMEDNRKLAGSSPDPRAVP